MKELGIFSGADNFLTTRQSPKNGKIIRLKNGMQEQWLYMLPWWIEWIRELVN